jgi:hypothetical protein
MIQNTAALAIVTGLLMRLAAPAVATVLVVVLLRRLDAHWKAEAEYLPVKVEKPECWKVKDCTPSQKKVCPAAKSPLPCWQVFRLPNGYLREECLTCQVLVRAPLPIRA